jgi:hypothetical protein
MFKDYNMYNSKPLNIALEARYNNLKIEKSMVVEEESSRDMYPID